MYRMAMFFFTQYAQSNHTAGNLKNRNKHRWMECEHRGIIPKKIWWTIHTSQAVTTCLCGLWWSKSQYTTRIECEAPKSSAEQLWLRAIPQEARSENSTSGSGCVVQVWICFAHDRSDITALRNPTALPQSVIYYALHHSSGQKVSPADRG